MMSELLSLLYPAFLFLLITLQYSEAYYITV